jgi:tRNA A37 threonylcarbamoyladenosine biosynthesis protein TsaE
VLLVEWGDPVANLLGEERLRISLEGDADEGRRISFTTVGAAWSTRDDEIAAVLDRWSGP